MPRNKKLYNVIIKINNNYKKLILFLIDFFILIIVFSLSLFIFADTYFSYIILFFLFFGIFNIFNFFFKIYSYPIRHTDENFFIKILIIQSLSALFVLIIFYQINNIFILSFDINLHKYFFIFVLNANFIFLSRITLRLILNYLNNKYDEKTHIIIYGAGNAGKKLMTYIESAQIYTILFFLDDNKKLHGKYIKNYKIIGDYNAFDQINKKKYNLLVLLAITKIDFTHKKLLINFFYKSNVLIKTIPSFQDIVENNINIYNIRSFDIEELILRKKINPKLNLIKKAIEEKNILITGAGGSIGSCLCMQIIKYKPKNIILLDHSELNLFNLKKQIQNSVLSSNYKIILGSINDEEFLRSVFKIYSIHAVYHTAAYKHVTLVENNIFEAFNNNIIGTYKIAKISQEFKIDYFVHVSTDKAVEPKSFMGLSKQISEKIICLFKREKIKNNISSKFSIVRFGNVLGSSGSVLEIFNNQIILGESVTVTDPDATRYFMTISEAAELVIQSAALESNEEVFVLDMGQPINILELAKKLIYLNGFKYYEADSSNNIVNKDNDNLIKIEFTGLRKGEKINEKLTENNILNPTLHPKIFTTPVKLKKDIVLSDFIEYIQKIVRSRDIKKAGELFNRDNF